MVNVYKIMILATASLILTTQTFLAQPTSTDISSTFSEVLSIALSNPKVLAVMIIQFLLGLGLGYFSVKALKYILALIAILALGSMLSVWSLGGSLEGFMTSLGTQVQFVIPLIMNILTTLGIMTVGPISIGFIIGVIIGAIRK